MGDLLSISAGIKSFNCLPRPSTGDEWGLLRVSAISKGVFLPQNNEAIPNDTLVKLGDRVGAFEVCGENILFCRSNSDYLVGSSVFVTNSPTRLLYSDKIWRLNPNADVINKACLYVMLNLPEMRTILRGLAHGSVSLQSITQYQLERIHCIVPDRDALYTMISELTSIMDN